MTIEEWKDDDGNLCIFIGTFNIEQKKIIFKRSDSLNLVDLLADIEIMKALDKGEINYLTTLDKLDFMNKVDSDVIATIANKILSDSSFEEAAKK